MAYDKIDSYGITHKVQGQATVAEINKKVLTKKMLSEETGDSLLHRLLNANGFFKRVDYDDYNRFYIFPRNDPYRMLGTTREYIFITKPDLHIFACRSDGSDVMTGTTLNKDLARDNFFRDLVDRGYTELLEQLQYSVKNKKVNPFIPLLSNYKTANVDLQSVSAGDMDTAANAFGTRIFYRRPTDTSDDENEFTIEFKDTKYLECYLLFKAYDVYEQKKYQGKIEPVSDSYIFNKILSDQMTVFKFIVGEDGETLIHWSCIWGCYPKTVPRDVFSELPQDGQLRFAINWHGAFQNDMDPTILAHFNALSDILLDHTEEDSHLSQTTMSDYKMIELWDSSIQAVTQKMAIAPRIIKHASGKSLISNYTPYKLVWYGYQ